MLKFFDGKGCMEKKLETAGLWTCVYAVEDQGPKWGFGC